MLSEAIGRGICICVEECAHPLAYMHVCMCTYVWECIWMCVYGLCEPV